MGHYSDSLARPYMAGMRRVHCAWSHVARGPELAELAAWPVAHGSASMAPAPIGRVAHGPELAR